jgi:formylglycine-generating enzyme required for sulfatase activity
MLIQRAGEEEGTRPPPGIPPPDWEALQVQWNRRKEVESVQEAKCTLGPSSVTLGHDDAETEDYRSESPMYDEFHEFGWDNEHPKRTVDVKKFTIERKPISNGEYHEFWSKKKGAKPPANWIVNESGVQVSVVALTISNSNICHL